MKYTVPQKTAVYYNKGNLLLSAAAGSGKTASLTARIVRLVLDGEATLSEMLIVTFTRAAAGEMRARIRKKLAEAVEENRGVDSVRTSRAASALSDLPSASISTIHSFLYREMRQYFPALGMPHDTRITDTGTAETMKADAMRDTVDDFFSRTGDDGRRFAYLADVIGQARDTTAIDRELLWLADKLTSGGQDSGALACLADELEKFAEGGGFFDTPMGEIVRGEVRELASHYERVFSDISLEFDENPDVAEKYGDTLGYMLDWLRGTLRLAVADGADFDAVRSCFADYQPPRLGTLSAKKVCPASEKFKFFRDRLKKDIAVLKESFFESDGDTARETARQSALILRITAEVLEDYFARLREMKRARSVIDYSDLETVALALFVSESGEPTAAAREVGAKFKYIFIDEYQDTNAVQDAIFRAVSENSVRFTVGDIKQSIYRFRGADPRVFSGYRRRWAPLEDGELIRDETEVSAVRADELDTAERGRSLFMSDNFRCDSAIIDFVNMVSDYTLSYGGIPYTADDRLICSKNGGDTPRTPVEVVLIEKKRAKKNADKDGDELTVTSNPEAAYVAGRIASLIGKYSPDGERVITPADIAVIMRSPGSTGEDYKRELALYGIPCATKNARRLTSYPSVMLILCLLNLIDNPMRDIYAAGALRSAVFGFTLGDIIELRSIAGDMPLFTAFDRVSGMSAELSEKCTRATEQLSRYRTVSRGMTADKFLEFLIRDTNLYGIEGIRASGEERDAIDRLCEMARSYESGGVFGGLNGFIDYIAEADSEAEGMAVDSAGAVSLMSIHSSKGLEFPIVFLVECGKRRNAADESGTVLYDDELGLGMMLPDGGGLARCDTVQRRAVAAKIKRESVAEEMRMLYVALTRAGASLTVTAKTADAEAEAAEAAYLTEYTDGYDAARATRYIDWVLCSAARRGECDFYNITAIPASSVLSGTASIAEAEPDDAELSMSVAELEARFEFAYPREYLASLPAKLTVSRLHPEILDEDAVSALAFGGISADESRAAEAPRPAFMAGERRSGAERGSATHAFMQFADFSRLTECGAGAELERLRDGGFISVADAELVDLRQIGRFVESSLMEKLRRTEFLKREFRFNVLMPAAEFTEDEALAARLSEEGVKITVQGVVDCVFRDPDTGELVLIDYKTDRVSAEEWRDRELADAAFRARHKNQLAYYKRICSRLFGEEIARAEIYSTVLGRCIAI